MSALQKKTVKYAHVADRELKYEPCNILCVDLIGPYLITIKHDKELALAAMTMCDPAIGWFEITEIEDRTAKHAAENVDKL